MSDVTWGHDKNSDLRFEIDELFLFSNAEEEKEGRGMIEIDESGGKWGNGRLVVG